MNSLNKVILTGYVGGDPKVVNFGNGGKVASVSLATSEHWKDKQTGEKKSSSTWHNLSFNNSYRKMADFAEKHLKKGTALWVEGSLKTRSWDSPEGKKYITEILVKEVGFLPVGKSESSSTQPATPSSEEDDLPF